MMEKRGIISRSTPAEDDRRAVEHVKLAGDLPASDADVAKIEAGPTRRLVDGVFSQAVKRERRPG